MLSLVQSYRGFAALLVVLYHSAATVRAYFGDAPHIFDFGWAGVQFFFVLSGFIIYHVHRDDVGQPRRLGRYVRKRILRIYPLYILVTLTLVPFWLLLPTGEPYHREIGALVKSLLLIPQQHSPHLAVAWTLIHEMIFYAAFATLLINKRLGVAVLGLWFGVVIVANLTQVTYAPQLGYLLSPNNLLFGLGMLAASGPHLGWKTFAAGNMAFLGTGLLVNAGNTAAILSFGTASLAILLSTKTLDEYFRNKALLLLGSASYAIYLIHYPVISLICKVLPDSTPPLVAFFSASLLSVACGIVLHVIVEQPMQAMLGSRDNSFRCKIRKECS